jgi:hypothetical protein
MKLSKTLLPGLTALAFASAASAQVLTEVRISTSGVDQEYVEILGNPGQSTDGLMILVVEGDPGGATGGAGNLDRVFDLSGDFFGGTDQYYVMGSVEADAAFGVGVIDNVPGDNLFENSSLTLYLVSVPDANLRADIDMVWDDTDITDPPGSTTTTRISTTPGITSLDAVGFFDGDAGDLHFDGAPILGPDGSFLPSGIIRNGGCPGDWCTDFFVDFGTGGGASGSYVDPTPGAINPTTACMTVASAGTCGGNGGIGIAYCMAVANSTGVTGVLGAMGSLTVSDNDVTLTASSLPVNAFGFFVVSRDQGFVMNPGGSSGNLCISGSVGRYVGPGQIQNSGAGGAFSLALDLMAIPQPTGSIGTAPGDTWNFQTWYRDAVGGVPTSNFTQGLEIMFL